MSQADSIYIRLNNVCVVIYRRIIKYEYLLESRTEYISNLQCKHQDNCWQNARHCDMPDLFPSAGTIYLGRFIQRFGDGGGNVGAGHHHVPHGHAAHQDAHPGFVVEAHVPDGQEGGNQAAVKEHGEGEQEGEQLLSRELPGKGERRAHGDHQADHRTRDRIQNGIKEGMNQFLVLEYRVVAQQRHAPGIQRYLAGGDQGGVGEGTDDHQINRILRPVQSRRRSAVSVYAIQQVLVVNNSFHFSRFTLFLFS